MRYHLIKEFGLNPIELHGRGFSIFVGVRSQGMTGMAFYINGSAFGPFQNKAARGLFLDAFIIAKAIQDALTKRYRGEPLSVYEKSRLLIDVRNQREKPQIFVLAQL
jgi:hypothetical protein